MLDFEQSCLINQKKKKQENLSTVIEKGNLEMSKLQTEYEQEVAKFRCLNDELKIKEEECDLLTKLQSVKHKEIASLKAKFLGIIKIKEEDIKLLKEKLVRKKQLLSEYKYKIQDLQQQLDKKTAEYKHVSSRLTQLEHEKKEQISKFKTMQKEYEKKLQREAAKVQGATVLAEEVKV